MNGRLEFSLQYTRMIRGDAGDQNALLAFEQFGGDFQDLFRGFARAEDDFGKTFPQSAMRVHLRKTEIRHGRCLERLENLLAADSARPKLFQEFDCFRRGHGLMIV